MFNSGPLIHVFSQDPRNFSTVGQVEFCLIVSLFTDNDRCGRKPRGRAKSRVLLPAVGSGGCLSLLLLQGNQFFLDIFHLLFIFSFFFWWCYWLSRLFYSIQTTNKITVTSGFCSLIYHFVCLGGFWLWNGDNCPLFPEARLSYTNNCSFCLTSHPTPKYIKFLSQTTKEKQKILTFQKLETVSVFWWLNLFCVKKKMSFRSSRGDRSWSRRSASETPKEICPQAANKATRCAVWDD